MHAGTHDLGERAQAAGAATAEEAFVREGRDHGRGGRGSLIHAKYLTRQIYTSKYIYKHTHLYIFSHGHLRNETWQVLYDIRK